MIINDFKYDNTIREIYGFYDLNSNNNFLRFEDYSFDLNNFNQKTGTVFYVKGLIAHFSTIESFQKISNQEQINNHIQLKSGDGIEEHISFVLLFFGDLKNYLFCYNFIEVNNNVDFKIKKITKLSSIDEEDLAEVKSKLNNTLSKDEQQVLKYFNHTFKNKDGGVRICIFDKNPSPNTIPSFIKNLIYKNRFNLDKGKVDIILVKDSKPLTYLTNSLVLDVEFTSGDENDNYKLINNQYQTVDLKQMFNPYNLAESAVDLNINLMKWRMAPGLNLEIIKKTKFLLIGAGTLGCHVSRCLIGWGVRNITFVDCGKVSYSNPVRQSLYTFKDSTQENPNKAILAAQKLKEIFPSVNSEGYNLQIPLPGRTLIGVNAEENFLKSINQLEKLIEEHDIIFLLTDSRESRWFPTLISKKLNKSVITAAIGFDSFVVIRHGKDENDDLGCYFCNDIVSPIDTSSNRTLDQQCTISRPGISSICSGFTCEMAISLLQQDNDVGAFVPQSIRGNLTDYNFMCLKANAFKK